MSIDNDTPNQGELTSGNGTEGQLEPADASNEATTPRLHVVETNFESEDGAANVEGPQAVLTPSEMWYECAGTAVVREVVFSTDSATQQCGVALGNLEQDQCELAPELFERGHGVRLGRIFVRTEDLEQVILPY